MTPADPPKYFVGTGVYFYKNSLFITKRHRIVGDRDAMVVYTAARNMAEYNTHEVHVTMLAKQLRARSGLLTCSTMA